MCTCRAFDCGHGHGRRLAARISEQRQRPQRGRSGRSLRARGHVRVLQRAMLELRSLGRAQRKPGSVRASLPLALWISGRWRVERAPRRHVVLAVAAGVLLRLGVCLAHIFGCDAGTATVLSGALSFKIAP